MIEIALASNRHYFPGLAATVVSLLLSNRQNPLHLHIIDGGLSEAQIRFLRRKTVATHQANQLTVHTISEMHFAGFTPDYGNSYMSYARIMVGSLVAADRVIYLDTDLLVAADLLPLWQTTLGENVAAAVQDSGIRLLREDYPFDEDCGDERYFNSGVMVINLGRWREMKAQEHLLKMIKASPTKFTWWDQTAMNALFRGQILFRDSRWNTFADSMNVRTPEIGAILHYVGRIKPWTRCRENVSYRVWRSFYAQHVRSQWTLFFDWDFTRSFIQEKRHTAIRCLQVSLMLGRLGPQSRESEVKSDANVAKCETVQSANRDNLILETTSASQIDAYVEHQWGKSS